MRLLRFNLAGILFLMCVAAAAHAQNVHTVGQYKVKLSADHHTFTVLRGVDVVVKLVNQEVPYDLVNPCSDWRCDKCKTALKPGVCGICKDVNGDGYPEVIVTQEWEGASAAGRVMHLLTLGPDVTGKRFDDAMFCNDINGDGYPELMVPDPTFDMWNASHSERFFLPVFLSWQTDMYRVEPIGMKLDQDSAAALAMKEIDDYRLRRFLDANPGSTDQLPLICSFVRDSLDWSDYYPYAPSDLWGGMLHLIYAGQADRAWSFFYGAWKPSAPDRDKFLEEFLSWLRNSPFYDDIVSLNGGSLKPVPPLTQSRTNHVPELADSIAARCDSTIVATTAIIQSSGRDPVVIATAYVNRAQAYGMKRDWDNMLKDCEDLVNAVPSYADGYFLRGRAKEELGRLDAADNDYSAAIRLDLKNTRFLRIRGVLRMKKGEYADAEKDFVHIDPNENAAAYFCIYRAICDRLWGDRATSNTILVTMPQVLDVEGWVDDIRLFLLSRLPEEEFLRHASASPKPKESECEAHYLVGMVYLAEGDKEKAREHFEQCLATGIVDFTEYSLAESELARLRK